MISVSIEGRAGQMLGPKWKLHVGTVGEALKALRANAEGIFQKALGFSKAYVLVVDGVPVENESWAFKKVKKSLLFIPVLAGGVISAIYNALWIALEVYMAAGVAQAIAMVIVVLTLALVAYGMYSLIMAMQDQPKIGDDDASRSFIFGGPENVTSQGGVVPVAYGRLRTGSKIISVSSTNVDRALWERNSLGSFIEGNVLRGNNTTPVGGGGGGGGIGTPFILK